MRQYTMYLAIGHYLELLTKILKDIKSQKKSRQSFTNKNSVGVNKINPGYSHNSIDKVSPEGPAIIINEAMSGADWNLKSVREISCHEPMQP